MTSQKTSPAKLAIIFIIGVSIIGVIFSTVMYSCGLNHILISIDIQKNNQNFEPEFCESIIERIDIFNENCDYQFEILDCS